jgi:hypothetical protein
VAKGRRKQNEKSLAVIVRHVVAPDAEQRLSRVVSLLLSYLARSNEKKSRHDKEITTHITKENNQW